MLSSCQVPYTSTSTSTETVCGSVVAGTCGVVKTLGLASPMDARCGETLESIGVVVVKALLCCGFHVACGDTCAVVKALGFCGKGKCTW